MPPDVVRQLRSFVGEFLNVVLSEIPLTSIICASFNNSTGFVLLDGHKPGLHRGTSMTNRSDHNDGHCGVTGFGRGEGWRV